MRARDGHGAAGNFRREVVSLGGFCKMGRKAGYIPSEYPTVIFHQRHRRRHPVFVVGRLRENSAPLQLTIAIKILSWVPSYELWTLAGRLTFATLAVTSAKTERG